MYVTSSIGVSGLVLVLLFLFTNRKRFALFAICVLVGWEIYAAQQIGEGVVVITGASSGLGREAALQLGMIGEGVQVWATVRRTQDVISLEKEAIERGARNLQVVIADVTKQEHLDSLVERLQRFTEKMGPIVAVVANAGVSGGSSPLEVELESQLRFVLEVNTIGVWRTAKSFMPLLRSSALDKRRTVVPRFVLVSSILGGDLVLSGTAQYSASKAAAEALTTGIRRELYPHVYSTVVRPGFFKTKIQKSATKTREASGDSHITAEHREVYPFWWNQRSTGKLGSAVEAGKDPSDAVPAIVRAALSRYPPNALYTGGPEVYLNLVSKLLPEFVFDVIAAQVNKV